MNNSAFCTMGDTWISVEEHKNPKNQCMLLVITYS